MNNFFLPTARVQLTDDRTLMADEPICTPDNAIRVLSTELSKLDREAMAVINLDQQLHPINASIVSVGILNSSLVHPREVLKASLLSNASFVILLHNHPSGSLAPSKEDIETTARMQQACNIIGVPLVDHIIVGSQSRYYSFKEHGVLETRAPQKPVTRTPTLTGVAERLEQYHFRKEKTIMDYDQFVQNLVNDLPSRLATDGITISTESKLVTKAQHEPYLGVVIRPEDGICGLSVDVRSFYKNMQEGMSYDHVLDQVAESSKHALEERPDVTRFLSAFAGDWKDKITMQVIPTESNREFLKDVPHREIEDMSIIYRVQVSEGRSYPHLSV